MCMLNKDACIVNMLQWMNFFVLLEKIFLSLKLGLWLMICPKFGLGKSCDQIWFFFHHLCKELSCIHDGPCCGKT